MHVALFPFMSKGHTIPLLQLAHILLRRYCHLGVAVTVITTPANHPFISSALSDSNASVITLPFPHHVHPAIPSGTESTDALPSISLFPHFALATKSMKPYFETALQSLVNLHGKANFFVISDGFLWWTLESCTKFSLPRLVIYGMSNYAMAVSRIVARTNVLVGVESEIEFVSLPEFPRVKVRRDDFSSIGIVVDQESQGPLVEFQRAVMEATRKSYGLLINSFHELEPAFDDFIRGNQGKSWSIGPLCLRPDHDQDEHTTRNGAPEPNWIVKWLDGQLHLGHSVLYVAFGTQAELSADQIKEIGIGLENSGASFLWVTRNYNGLDLPDGLLERIKDRGIVVCKWVDQREILSHPSVKGFLSHCGWNSILESVSSGVPVLAWPLMAEQPLNAKMVVEELRMGLRVETADGLVGGFVGWEKLKEKIVELMEGERGREARKRAKEYQEMARKAMEEGSGSSWRNLDQLVHEICHEN